MAYDFIRRGHSLVVGRPILAVALVSLLCLGLGALVSPGMLPAFLTVIAAVPCVAGMGPAVLEAILSASAMKPSVTERLLANGAAEPSRPGIFMAVALLTAAAITSHRRAHRTAMQLADEIRRFEDRTERRIRERTAALSLACDKLRAEMADRKSTEASRQQDEQWYRALVEASPDAVVVLDLDGRIIMANRLSSSVFGYSRVEDVMGQSGYELIHTPERPRALQDLQRALDGGTLSDVQYTMARQDGSTFPAELSGASVPGSDGRPAGLILVVHDITERQRLQNQFMQAQKMEAVGVLAGGIAHDFNNILTVILGTSECLLMDLPPDDPKRREVEAIRSAGQRAASLTSQLLAFSRKQERRLAVLDLNQVVSDMENMLRRLLGEDIDLRTIKNPGLWAVQADPGQMLQVVMNLAINARDAMPGGGKLTIETANVEFDTPYTLRHPIVRIGRYAMLAVTDNGMGMDRETLNRVFEPFFTTKEQGRGTGLGLSTVYGIVKQSEGFIWVYSEPGQGTTFKVYLPRVDSQGEPTPARSPLPPLRTPRRDTGTILLVEDDPQVRELAGRILSAHGYEVIEAATAEEALASARTHPREILLLITDMVMPKMTGRELAGRIALIRPATRTLFMSGYSGRAIVHQGILEPDAAFLAKPFTPESLIEKVRDVVCRA